MGYDFRNISELETFDFSNTNSTKDNATISRDGTQFVVEGESITTYTQQQAKDYISASNSWKTLKPVINEINVDYVNETYTATLSNLAIIDIGIQSNILELQSIFEGIYVNPIDTIKATFTSGSILIFNNDLTVNCATIATENTDLYNLLAELFQNIKIDIMFKIN
jgi:hypothetical protein